MTTREVSLVHEEGRRRSSFAQIDDISANNVLEGKETLHISPVAAHLVNKGISVDQLLAFYEEYRNQGIIQQDTTTAQVVSMIVIPETCDPPRCYMDSDFMRMRGGGRRATRLCSHAWGTRFVNTVLNIALDATEWSRDEFIKSTTNNGWDAYYRDGYLDARRLRQNIKAEHLNKAYWLCVFAVDEHRAICGDCWGCRSKPEWQADPAKHMQANPCLICQKPKFNPCSCGSKKYVAGDPFYEIDQFPEVVAQMHAHVVSLDPHMVTIKRVWVVAEIGEAMQFTTVFFRLALGLAPEVMQKLIRGDDLMETVEECESTSDEDKSRIMKVIRAMDGGVAAYDQFVNTMLEIHFGRCTRLSRILGAGIGTVGLLSQLEMDYSWYTGMKSTSELMGDIMHLTKLQRMQKIDVSFAGCSELASIDDFCEGLGLLQSLNSLSLDFGGCHKLASLDALGQALRSLIGLASVTLNFASCDVLVSIDELGYGLAALSNLTLLKIDFEGCEKLASISGLGEAMAELHCLTVLNLNFTRCTSLVYADPLGKGFAGLRSLTSLEINFYNCDKLQFIVQFGKGLGSLTSLSALGLNFWNCGKLKAIQQLGSGLRCMKEVSSFALNLGFTAADQECVTKLSSDLSNLSTLTSLTLNLSACMVSNMDRVAKSLAKLERLTTLVLFFDGSEYLASVKELGDGLSQLKRLDSLEISFLGCRAFVDCNLESFANCASVSQMSVNFSACDSIPSIVLPDWSRCSALSALEISCMHCMSLNVIATSDMLGLERISDLQLNFFGCENLVSIDELGDSLAMLKTLTSLTLNFSNCFALPSVDALGKCLSGLYALTALSLEFAGCANVNSMDELWEALLGLEGLKSLKVDVSGAYHPMKIRSIDKLVASMTSLCMLESVTLKFGLCEQLELGDMTDMAEKLGSLQAIAHFYLDLRGCRMVQKHMQKEFIRIDDFVDASKSEFTGTVTGLSAGALAGAKTEK